MKHFALSFFIFFSFSLSAYAGGTMTAGQEGTPPVWKDGVIHWKADSGEASALITNAQALGNDGFIKPFMKQWEGISLYDETGQLIPSVNISFVYDGAVGEDINPTNFDKYFNGDWTQEPVALIVFDDDGKILEELGSASAIDPHKTIGLTLPLLDSTGQWMIGGMIIVNGKWRDGLKDSDIGNYELPDDLTFKAAIGHEVGHLLNLDHASVNGEVEENCSQPSNCTQGNLIPTMFPKIVSSTQWTLNPDDKIMLASLYPTQEFQEKFCSVKGTVVGVNSKGIPGINIIARDIQNPYIDARSFVSGGFYPQGTDADENSNGDYVLHGLIPEKEYEIDYDSLPKSFVGPSGFEPLDNPPQVEKGVILNKDGDHVIKCQKGGEMIVMKTLNLPLEVKASGIFPATPGTAPVPQEKKQASCSLNEQATWSPFFLLPFLIILVRRCIPKKR